ncbi:glycine betaine ABC transporter substrate-binding protein [Oceanobacillus halotolerans]|uniref:glycine betaine ABC transporter substrate-binding protein n=1 Tax=Oceanobacillus halotolerans TaxID=2663380 RepID=UPI0013DA0C7B|nr:glycine betaine ABC transporter substrate-binding protein [Oceanobacillus halotolerans]
MLILTIVTVLTACNGDQEESNDNNGSENNEEQKTISIGLDPYDYATVPAYLTKEILEQEGYEVNIEEGQVGILYEALANKEIEAFIDIWSPNLQSSYLEEYKGEFEVAGTLYSDMPIGVAVPTYMDHVNSIEDLIEYKDEFNEEVYAIDPGSGMAQTTEEMVEAYDMQDFEIKNSSTAAMLAQAESVMENEGGIVFNAWRPHPMFVRLDIKFLDDPENVWKLDDVQIGVTPDLKEQSPTAYTLFSNMKLTLDGVEEWIMALDEGKAPEELAKEWVEDNPDKVDEWLEK